MALFRVILVLLLVPCSYYVSGQHRSSFYLEGFGHGIVYSVNYEKIRVRENQRHDYSYFVGLYLNPLEIGGVGPSFGIPVGVNRLQKVKNSYMEVGLGLTFMYGLESANTGSAYLYSRLGYRKNFKKTYLRLSLHPVYIINTSLFNRPGPENFGGEFAVWPGIAFGFYRD